MLYMGWPPLPWMCHSFTPTVWLGGMTRVTVLTPTTNVACCCTATAPGHDPWTDTAPGPAAVASSST